MSKTRFEIEKAIAEREEAERNERGRRLGARVKDLLEPIRRAQEGLDDLVSSTKKIIKEKDRAFPVVTNSPWKEGISQIRELLNFARARVDTIKSRLQALRDEIENPRGEGLKIWTMDSLERGLRDKAGGLRGEVEMLRELPKKIADIEKGIDESVAYWAGREQIGQGYTPRQAIPVTRQPESSEGKQEDEFDPRLS